MATTSDDSALSFSRSDAESEWEMMFESPIPTLTSAIAHAEGGFPSVESRYT